MGTGPARARHGKSALVAWVVVPLLLVLLLLVGFFLIPGLGANVEDDQSEPPGGEAAGETQTR